MAAEQAVQDPLSGSRTFATAKPCLTELDRRNRRAFLLLVGPSVLILLAIIVFPMVYSLATAFRYSVLYKPQVQRFVGLNNFVSLVTSNYTQVAFVNTVLYATITVTAELIGGFLLALLLSRSIYGARYLRTALMMPILLSPIVVGLSWRFMYNPSIGIIDQSLQALGASPVNWLTDPKLAFWAAMIPDIWQWTPFVTLVLLAGIHSIPPDIHEAALLDGLRLRHLVRFIYLPMLIPVVAIVVLIRFIDAFKTFDVVFILTHGGPGLLTMLISIRTWTLGLVELNMGQAAALSYLMVISMSVFAILLLRLVRRRAS